MQSVEELSRYYNKVRAELKKRLSDFKNVNGDAIFYECCFCILTPQSNAKQCWAAVERLIQNSFIDKNINPEPLVYPIRFYKNKARYLVQMKNNFGMIKGSMEKIKDGRQLRNHFARNVVGYGMKEASHFMRNVGYRNLAILDRHILKNLCHFGVIETIPRTMTPGIYHEIEEKFVQFSKKLGIPMDELDLLFWSAETGEIFK